MLEVRSRCREQQFQEPKVDCTFEICRKNYNIKLTERYQSRYNDSTRFRASAALGDVLVRVARRAGIVVILEWVGNKAVFKLRLHIKRPHLLYLLPDRPYLHKLNRLLPIMVRGNGTNKPRLHEIWNNRV